MTNFFAERTDCAQYLGTVVLIVPLDFGDKNKKLKYPGVLIVFLFLDQNFCFRDALILNFGRTE